MKVTALVENTTHLGLSVEHGLSLHVAFDDGRNLLFDVGQGRLFADNALQLGVSVADVDVAVISHGHYDHGGGLAEFLQRNNKATVYVHNKAFQPHYSLRDSGLTYIGLDAALKDNPRLFYCGDTHIIDEGVMLFAGVDGECCYPRGNRLLFGPGEHENDTFCHEQSLLVEEGPNLVLFAGCAHTGIVNIVNRAVELAGRQPTHVFAGMHLVKSGLSTCDEDAFIRELAGRLNAVDNCRFFTMHCTGVEQFQQLKSYMGERISYLACGDSVKL